MGSMKRGARAILETGEAFFSEASKPFVRGGPRDPAHLSDMGNRPPEILDSMHDQPSSERGESSPTMRHESLLLGRELWSAPNRAGRLSSVNNLGGNYI